MSLAARAIEEAGIPTVIVGSARDIVEHCGVPRFLFTDLPLGNPAGWPERPDMQREVVGIALRLLASAPGPRTTEVAPVSWKDDPGWRARYAHIDPEKMAKLRAEGEERRRRQAEAKALKEG